MIIFGIDPGSHATGYGIIEDASGRLSLVHCGTILTSSGDTLPQRVRTIFEQLTELVTKYKPDEMAVEDLFNAKNARSSLILGHARGVALLSGAMADITVDEYAPREVKKALTG
ncbi:crossover junction endodeoxyribonuclease RuvC, partial [bacterium]|nr:crossover junction endodeoxyribonuclease RuvC [bacterium]